MFDSDVHAYLRAAGRDRAHRAGPFLAFFDAEDPGLYRNYAVPDDGAVPTTSDVKALITAFTDRSRTPRLEYLPGICESVEPALKEAGFITEARLPVLTCPPGEVITPPLDEDLSVFLATTDDHLRQAASAQNAAFGQEKTTDHDVTRLRRLLERGGLVALAVDTSTGMGVGGGQCGPPLHGVSELAGIGVRTSHRRRGVAAALTALLTRACPDAGITTPFLTPADEAAGRVYQRAGYRTVGEMLHISLP